MLSLLLSQISLPQSRQIDSTFRISRTYNVALAQFSKVSIMNKTGKVPPKFHHPNEQLQQVIFEYWEWYVFQFCTLELQLYQLKYTRGKGCDIICPWCYIMTIHPSGKWSNGLAKQVTDIGFKWKSKHWSQNRERGSLKRRSIRISNITTTRAHSVLVNFLRQDSSGDSRLCSSKLSEQMKLLF